MHDLDHLPRPADKRIAIRVKPAAARALRGGHPWLFAGAIRHQSREGQPGDLAVIFDAKKRFLAVGLYDPASPIRVRVLQHGQPAPINQDWFAKHLHAAADHRAPLHDQPTTGYRLVYGANDYLPGLVIDRYAATLVLKLYTAAWLPHLRAIVEELPGVLPVERLVLRTSRGAARAFAEYGLADGAILSGPPLTGPVEFVEHGLRFAADVVQGHKTGFFFDQRDNRARVRQLAAGRRVLDVFAYSGGFSVYAAAGGAATVTSMDSSAPALASAEANLALNRRCATGQTRANLRAAHHITLAEDAFDCLDRLHAAGTTFDLVIVDPPAFAKRAAEVKRARTAYARLTRLALGVLAADGVLVMASCSSRVTPDAFVETVTDAARAAGRPLTDITRSGHPLDHPVRFPEGEYLQCLFATVR